jgi:predicted aminopeptidase
VPKGLFRFQGLLIPALLVLTGCADLAYFRQSAMGQLSVMRQARPVTAVLTEDSSLTPRERRQLDTVATVRDFAADTLELSFNDSYTRFVDLGRPYVVRNLVAAPEFSTELHAWCYPVIGCAGYRGYFDEVQLEAERSRLAQLGYDTWVYDVRAYSTLGWFSDPVMRTFLAMPTEQLVELLIHELAHQQLYINDDTAFNESFASAVAQVGAKRFFERSLPLAAPQQGPAVAHLEETVAALAQETRNALESLYASDLDDAEKRMRKRAILDGLAARYRALEDEAYPGANLRHLYELPLNNARLGLIQAYSGHTEAFTNMIRALDNDMPRFYRLAEHLSALAPAERAACLANWAGARGDTPRVPAQCFVEPT